MQPLILNKSQFAGNQMLLSARTLFDRLSKTVNLTPRVHFATFKNPGFSVSENEALNHIDKEQFPRRKRVDHLLLKLSDR